MEPGERTPPHDFGSGRDYRGGNAVLLAMNALDRGYTVRRWSTTKGSVRRGRLVRDAPGRHDVAGGTGRAGHPAAVLSKLMVRLG